MPFLRLLLTAFVFVVLSSHDAFAQDQMIGAESRVALGELRGMPIEQLAPTVAPLGADVAITYLQTTNTQVSFTAPLVLGSNILVVYGERITLPAASGYLDSVSVELNGISNDSIAFLAIPDTLFQTASGPFHLMNIFDPNAKSSLIGYIHVEQISGRTRITFRLPHLIVPKNFWLALQPNFVAATKQFTNSYQLIADTEAVRARTTDNSHSGFLYVNSSTGQYSSSLFDSTFTNSATNTRYFSNFAFTAYADLTASSVDQAASTTDISLYPNPANRTLDVRSSIGENATIDLVDVLGRKLLSAPFNRSASLDVSKLQPGRYEAIVTSGGSVSHASVIIGH